MDADCMDSLERREAKTPNDRDEAMEKSDSDQQMSKSVTKYPTNHR